MSVIAHWSLAAEITYFFMIVVLGLKERRTRMMSWCHISENQTIYFKCFFFSKQKSLYRRCRLHTSLTFNGRGGKMLSLKIHMDSRVKSKMMFMSNGKTCRHKYSRRNWIPYEWMLGLNTMHVIQIFTKNNIYRSQRSIIILTWKKCI